MNNRQMLELLNKQTEILDRLASNNDTVQKAPSGVGTYTPLHGDGGIWNTSGLSQDIVTAHVRPFGIGSVLPSFPSVSTDPRYGVLTGYTDVSGSEPTNVCDDAPAGYVKGCTLTAQFGMVRRDSQEIDITKAILKLNRGDFTDLMLRGRVLGLGNLQPSDIQDGNDILNVVSASEMVTVGVNLERVLGRRYWQGVAATGQMPGLDSQITDGIKDINGTLCPAVDSDIKDFGWDDVDGSGRDIVEYLSMMEYYLRYNAMTMGLEPVTWVVVMRPELWYELTSVWPCSYNTTKCVDAMVGNNARTVIDGRENVLERDNMRNNMYIDINGNRYDVVVDTGIFEYNSTNSANVGLGEFASSIYMVPLSIVGGMPVTYREYVDYRQAQTDYSYTDGKLDVWWTDNGLYTWSLTQEKWCYIFHALSQQRIVLRTPHLAGKLQRVKYSPLQHLREGYPDSPYFKDGGVSYGQPAPSFQAAWL